MSEVMLFWGQADKGPGVGNLRCNDEQSTDLHRPRLERHSCDEKHCKSNTFVPFNRLGTKLNLSYHFRRPRRLCIYTVSSARTFFALSTDVSKEANRRDEIFSANISSNSTNDRFLVSLASSAEVPVQTNLTYGIMK